MARKWTPPDVKTEYMKNVRRWVIDNPGEASAQAMHDVENNFEFYAWLFLEKHKAPRLQNFSNRDRVAILLDAERVASERFHKFGFSADIGIGHLAHVIAGRIHEMGVRLTAEETEEFVTYLERRLDRSPPAIHLGSMRGDETTRRETLRRFRETCRGQVVKPGRAQAAYTKFLNRAAIRGFSRDELDFMDVTKVTVHLALWNKRGQEASKHKIIAALYDFAQRNTQADVMAERHYVGDHAGRFSLIEEMHLHQNYINPFVPSHDDPIPSASELRILVQKLLPLPPHSTTGFLVWAASLLIEDLAIRGDLDASDLQAFRSDIGSLEDRIVEHRWLLIDGVLSRTKATADVRPEDLKLRKLRALGQAYDKAARPSAAWLTASRPILEDVDPYRMARAFSEDLQSRVPDWVWPDPRMGGLKATVWLAARWPIEVVGPALVDFVELCFGKVPGHGTRSEGLGNAALWALENHADPEAVSYFRELQRRSLNPKAAKWVQKALQAA